MHRVARTTRGIFSICFGLLVLGACEGVQIGSDALYQTAVNETLLGDSQSLESLNQ
jgi:hypothetical protein